MCLGPAYWRVQTHFLRKTSDWLGMQSQSGDSLLQHSSAMASLPLLAIASLLLHEASPFVLPHGRVVSTGPVLGGGCIVTNNGHVSAAGPTDGLHGSRDRFARDGWAARPECTGSTLKLSSTAASSTSDRPTVGQASTTGRLRSCDIEVGEASNVPTQIGSDVPKQIVTQVASSGDCEGFLLERGTGSCDSVVFEIHISPSEDDTLDRLVGVLSRLLVRYLSIEQGLYVEERDGGSPSARIESSLMVVVEDDSLPEELLQESQQRSNLTAELEKIGIPSKHNRKSFLPSYTTDGLQINLGRFVPYLNKFAYRNRGTVQGELAMELLVMLSRRRVPFNFEAGRRSSSTASSNVISHQRQVVPESTVDDALGVVDQIRRNGWLSTNPDSVDGLPSLHLNIISSGRRMFDDGQVKRSGGKTTLATCVNELADLLEPHLCDTLLPRIKAMTNSSTVEISDVFIRSYGASKSGRGSEVTRYGLSAHYDVTAATTCVIALDDIASSGRNGLYTVIPSEECGSTSHAAMRAFFPLERGDGVAHTYATLHGVNVDPELNRPRTSLIVWFTDPKGEGDSINEAAADQPWLLDPIDDVGEFVLGLAAESAVSGDGTPSRLKEEVDPIELYISSASKGNVFAMTALAQKCDDGLIIGEEYYRKIREVIAEHDEDNPYLPPSTEENGGCEALAVGLWYHAAIHGGHRVAQACLADEIVLRYVSGRDHASDREAEDAMLRAACLFAMAHGQGDEGAGSSLKRLMDVELERLSPGSCVDLSEEAVMSSPVARTILNSLHMMHVER